jgi:hypothetical protein
VAVQVEIEILGEKQSICFHHAQDHPESGGCRQDQGGKGGLHAVHSGRHDQEYPGSQKRDQGEGVGEGIKD